MTNDRPLKIYGVVSTLPILALVSTRQMARRSHADHGREDRIRRGRFTVVEAYALPEQPDSGRLHLWSRQSIQHRVYRTCASSPRPLFPDVLDRYAHLEEHSATLRRP